MRCQNNEKSSDETVKNTMEIPRTEIYFSHLRHISTY